jgi:hypothetical protein
MTLKNKVNIPDKKEDIYIMTAINTNFIQEDLILESLAILFDFFEGDIVSV